MRKTNSLILQILLISVIAVSVFLIANRFGKRDSESSAFLPNEIANRFKIFKISNQGLLDYSEELLLIPNNSDSIDILRRWYQPLNENLNKSNGTQERALVLIDEYSKKGNVNLEPIIFESKVIHRGLYIDLVYDRRNVVYARIWQN